MAGDTVEQIKQKLDVVEFLRGFMTLTPAGRNFKGLCPFHKEKTPSFMVSPERQSWRCFGCGVGGDIFTFIMQHDGLEFAEALKILADKAGIELRRVSPQEYKLFGLLYDIQSAAKEFFRNQLEATPIAREYLASRKLTAETINEFELGWAPQVPDILTIHLLNMGYAPEDLIRAGVTVKTERGMQFDRFRGRVMFPIHNHLGKVVGFTGRLLPQFDTGEMGKYVNSPETAIFQKSKLLYGFWKSKNPIRETGAAFLVEGQMDFLMSFQAGVRNAVATSGTALTLEHLKTLHRVADTLLVSFDNDEAGFAAGERAIDLAEANDFGVKVVTLEGVKDPAEAAEKDPEGLRRAVENAKPAMRIYFERYLKDGAVSLRDREGLKKLRLVLGKIKNLSSPAERSLWLSELAQLTGIAEKVLMEESEKLETSQAPAQKSPAEILKEKPNLRLSRRELLSSQLLGAAFAAKALERIEKLLEWFPENIRALYEVLRAGKNYTGDSATDEMLEFIILSAREEDAKEWEVLVLELEKEYLKDRRTELVLAVKRAEAAGQDASVLLGEIKNLPLL